MTQFPPVSAMGEQRLVDRKRHAVLEDVSVARKAGAQHTLWRELKGLHERKKQQ
jgi:hypothetical protein